ncbi:leucine-rich repeat-containing protein 24 isoform X2 [Drosophila obscura]|uniref:leucine-rich repeat-containing protein 24 isoform X2 n=1 Tax=Drosophila obscura TaxID=7282 RepID=UPI001BB0D7F4|nr:leucine-rich repeat-containing protein 24 isoform X2 [Drosophila obscura]
MALQCVIKPKMWLGLKQILLYVGLLLCVLLQVCRSKTQLQMYCPTVCQCDLHAQRNRAVCSAKRLISANIEMPKTVELLDLSYNDITSIDDDSFQSTVHLVNLTLAHNAIHTLYVDGFAELRRLRHLDLSYNRLEQIDEHLLESNSQLIHLNLEGNKLATLGTGPLLRSPSLRSLNLRNSQINQLGAELLSALPQLRQLDLAQNLLITLSSGVFHAPRFLASLNLEENPFNCDRALTKVATGLRQRGVVIFMSDCAEEEPLPPPEEVELELEGRQTLKFERLENLEPTTQGPQSVLAVWRELDSSEENSDEQDEQSSVSDVCEGSREKLCLRYRTCLERVSHQLLAGGDAQLADEIERSQKYDPDDLKLAFVVGGATGICMVIFIITFALCLKSCCELRKKKCSQELAEGEADPSQEALPTIHTWSPHRTRNPRRSNTQRSSRAVVRQPYGPQDSFVSRLFGRPARSQYYRTINQNTATLIRRLSRSNLFSSRDRERITPTTPPESTSRFYTDDVAGGAARPETPPPNYGDVVVIDNCDNK